MKQLLEEFLQENPDRSKLERNGAILSRQRGLVHQMELPPLTPDELIAVQDMASRTAGLPWPGGGGQGFRLEPWSRDPNTPQGRIRGLRCMKPQDLVERQQASQRELHQHHTRRRRGVLEMDEWRDEGHAWGGSQRAGGPEAQEARRQREAQKEARRKEREHEQQRRAAERARVQQGQEERETERVVEQLWEAQSEEQRAEAQRAGRAVALAERAAAAKERNPNPNPNPNPSPNPSSNPNPNPSPSPNQAEGGPWHVDEAGGEGYTARAVRAAAALAARDKGSAAPPPRRVLQKCSKVGLLLSQLGDEPTS